MQKLVLDVTGRYNSMVVEMKTESPSRILVKTTRPVEADLAPDEVAQCGAFHLSQQKYRTACLWTQAFCCLVVGGWSSALGSRNKSPSWTGISRVCRSFSRRNHPLLHSSQRQLVATVFVDYVIERQVLDETSHVFFDQIQSPLRDLV